MLLNGYGEFRSLRDAAPDMTGKANIVTDFVDLSR